MSRVAPVVPSESSLLCEACGYVLDGLPTDSACPECGRPIADSIGLEGPHARTPPAWERDGATSPASRFLTTTAAVLFRPTRFFRTFTTRPAEGERHRGAGFGDVYALLAGLLFGTAAFLHALWYVGLPVPSYTRRPWAEWTYWAGWLVAVVCGWVLLGLTTRIAARLTAWEARYRGLRLPLPVVVRGLQYHAAHYLPVALAVLATVVGFHILQPRVEALSPNQPFRAIITYHLILGGEVIVAAYYLFRTYWIGMRNMMYANR